MKIEENQKLYKHMERRESHLRKFDFLNTVSTTMLIVFGIIISLVIFSISAILSIKFFEKSDLA